jgi:glycosyltransferase involved in cell wall biosynthesis
MLHPPQPKNTIAQGLFSYQIGGSERVGADLALEFQRRGHRVICFAFYDSDGPIRRELLAAGIECVDLNYERRNRMTRRLSYQLEIFAFLRRNAVDALLVHHATALILCGIPARLARVRSVVMVEHAIHQLRERPDYRRTAMRFLRFADYVTAVDPGIAEYFRTEMKVPEARVRYIANGVRPRDVTPGERSAKRTALGLREGVFAFLFAGRLQPVKDVDTLLRSFAILVQSSHGDFHLLIAGDGSERGRLETLAVELRLVSRVTFLGARGDVPELMAAADAFVMTSVSEGQPMAIIEAMAAGLPTIATSVGGIPALLEGGAGLLAPAGNPAKISDAMHQVATSEQLRRELAADARKRVLERHSLPAIADGYLRLLCLAGPSTSSSNNPASRSPI